MAMLLGHGSPGHMPTSSSQSLYVLSFAATACFSGDTKVVVQGSNTPVAMRDLKTGQRVQCLDSGADLTQPSAVKWCDVMAWLHAEPKQLQQTRITFTRAGGSTGSITVSPSHMVLKLTGDSVAVGATATTVAACKHPFMLGPLAIALVGAPSGQLSCFYV